MAQRGIENQRETKQEDSVCSRVEDGVRGFFLMKRKVPQEDRHTQWGGGRKGSYRGSVRSVGVTSPKETRWKLLMN